MVNGGHVRNGAGTVRAYVYGPVTLLPWLEKTFGARVVEGSAAAGEVQVRIGDSMLALALGDDFPVGAATRSSIYVYVEDADSTYRAAIASGASELSPPADKPYGERQGGVTDVFGNVWYIATYLGEG